MSLILEALKKSEDKRRLGAAPDLATPFSAPRRRNWVWPIAAVLLAVGLIAWALRPASAPPSVADTATKPSAPATRASPGQKTGAPLRSVTGGNDLAQAAPPDNLPKPAPPASGTADKFVYGQPDPNAPATENHRGLYGAARERRRADQANNHAPPPPPLMTIAQPPAAKVTAAAVAAPPAAVPIAAAAPVAAAAQVATAAPPPANVAAPQKAEVPATQAPASGRAPKTAATIGLTPTPAATLPIKATSTGGSAQPYSELPFSVRKSLPELRLSMHVYLADPSRRFVVLNDSRLIEGEKTNDDIFVREIRPDGVVLEFQNQRFFYPRDGL